MVTFSLVFLLNFDGFSRASQFQSGDLKMAARLDDSMRGFDSGNSENRVEIRFVDEDDLRPLAHVMEHRASEEEFYSGESEYSEENSGDEGSADNLDEEMDDAEEEWSAEIRRDINFDNDACGINVDTGNLTSCLDFLELFFTSEVWQLSVTQTNLYAEQKREPAERSVWYPVTENEMKAWLSLCLNMGLVTKPNISACWSTDPVLSSPFLTSVMSRTRFQQILFYLHFADNNLASPHDSEEHKKPYKI